MTKDEITNEVGSKAAQPPTECICQLGAIGKFEEIISLFSFVTADSDVFQKPKPSYAQYVVCHLLMTVSPNHIGQMTRVIIIMLLFQLTIFCKPQDNIGELYVSNMSLDQFDSALIKVSVDNDLIYDDTVTNKYISHHWDQKTFSIPADSFRVAVSISGLGFNINKDTTLSPGLDREQMFIQFNFYPHYKRYRNPEIYSHVKTGAFDLKQLADSLYKNNILKSADNYLNDTIPLPTNIDILFKKREKRSD